MLGAPELDDARMDRWCQLFGIVGVVVQYQLAPEHPYPAGIEDCYAGLRWVKEHRASLGIDSARVGIGGVSAGGGLAAALALLARDRNELELDYQLLIYPMIDDRAATVTARWDVPLLDGPTSGAVRLTLEFGWRLYLDTLFGAAAVPPHAAATRATDLLGLPSTYVVVGTLDAFADECIEYAQRLNHAGTPVELHVDAGAPHSFDVAVPDAAIAVRARRDLESWLAVQLRVPTREAAS